MLTAEVTLRDMSMGNMWCGGDEGQFAVLAASVSAQIGLPGTPSHRARLPSAPACRRPRGRWVSAGDYTLRGCPDSAGCAGGS